MKEELEKNGYYIYREIAKPWVNDLRKGIDISFEKDEKSVSVAAHCILQDRIFIEFLERLNKTIVFKDIKDNYFKSPFILNSMSALRIAKDKESFSSEIHRDVRFFTGNCNLMLNTLVVIDDFTKDNGATWLYPKSHLHEEYIYENGIQIEVKAGDIIVWNSNLLHKSGQNFTDDVRRGLAITFSKSCYKQLLNYPKALELNHMCNVGRYSQEILQLLGYDAQVPENIEEWYNLRTYKKNQD